MDGFLWLKKFIYVTLVAAQNSYDIGAASADLVHTDVAAATDYLQRPTHIFFPARYTTGGTETPVEQVGRSDWSSLPNKTTTGTVVQVYYDPQIAMGKLYVWPTPATGVTDKIKMTVDRILEDVGTDESTFDLPPEALEMLKFNLALRLAPEYALSVQSTTFIEKYAMALKAKLESFQQDNASVFFQPDYRGR
jgi:hypothetical protein